MKAKLLIGICTVVCLNMFGQANSTEYFPVGTSWQEAYYVIYYDTIKSPIIRNVVTGDTIIEGVKYKCVEETKYDIMTNTVAEESEPYRYAIREQGDSIFSRVFDGEEKLMYIFGSWKIGDSIPCFQDTIARISQITLLDEKMYECVDTFPAHRNQSKDYSPKMVINSIGRINKGLLRKQFLPRGGWDYILLSFTRNGCTIYRDERFGTNSIEHNTYRPNPVKETYSLSGIKQKGMALPSKGIYIRNGKKVMVK